MSSDFKQIFPYIKKEDQIIAVMHLYLSLFSLSLSLLIYSAGEKSFSTSKVKFSFLFNEGSKSKNISDILSSMSNRKEQIYFTGFFRFNLSICSPNIKT